MTTITKCALGCNAPATSTADFFEKSVPVCRDNWASRHLVDPSPCDFCGEPSHFKRVFDQWGQGHWLEGLEGSGSDSLAIWCGDCGPKHRDDNDRIYREAKARLTS